MSGFSDLQGPSPDTKDNHGHQCQDGLQQLLLHFVTVAPTLDDDVCKDEEEGDGLGWEVVVDDTK